MAYIVDFQILQMEPTMLNLIFDLAAPSDSGFRVPKRSTAPVFRRFSIAMIPILMVLAGCGGGNSTSGAGGTAPSMAGKWNVVLTDTGASHPTYTFGMAISQGGDSLTAAAATYTGGTVYGTNCFNTADLTAVGTLTDDAMSMTITDPSSGAEFKVTGTLNGASNADQGTFSFPQITEDARSITVCGGDSGAATLTLQ